MKLKLEFYNRNQIKDKVAIKQTIADEMIEHLSPPLAPILSEQHAVKHATMLIKK